MRLSHIYKQQSVEPYLNSKNIVDALSSVEGTNPDRQNEMLSVNSYPIHISRGNNTSAQQQFSSNARSELHRGAPSDKNNTIKQFNNFIDDGANHMSQIHSDEGRSRAGQYVPLDSSKDQQPSYSSGTNGGAGYPTPAFRMTVTRPSNEGGHGEEGLDYHSSQAPNQSHASQEQIVQS